MEAPPTRRDDGGLADEGLDGAGSLTALRVADRQVGDVVGAHRHIILSFKRRTNRNEEHVAFSAA